MITENQKENRLTLDPKLANNNYYLDSIIKILYLRRNNSKYLEMEFNIMQSRLYTGRTRKEMNL